MKGGIGQSYIGIKLLLKGHEVAFFGTREEYEKLK